MTPDEGRNRLCAGIYAPDDEGEPLADLEKALVLMPRLNALQGKIRAAMKAGELHPAPGEELAAAARAGGVITEDEESFFKEATALVRAVIDVDDFDPEDLTCQR
jgi:acyl-CoA dehydrogenase